MKKREGLLTISTTGFPPRIKYGVTPCQARGRLFFRGNDGEMSTRPRQSLHPVLNFLAVTARKTAIMMVNNRRSAVGQSQRFTQGQPLLFFLTGCAVFRIQAQAVVRVGKPNAAAIQLCHDVIEPFGLASFTSGQTAFATGQRHPSPRQIAALLRRPQGRPHRNAGAGFWPC